QKAFSTTASQSFTFPIGDASSHDPVALSALTPSVAGSIKASTTAGNHPSLSTSGLDPTWDVAQYWTLTSVSGTYNAFTAAFTYPSSKATGTASRYTVKRYSSSAWSSGGTISGTPTTTLTTISSVTGFGDFAIGDPAASNLAITSVPASATAGVSFS